MQFSEDLGDAQRRMRVLRLVDHIDSRPALTYGQVGRVSDQTERAQIFVVGSFYPEISMVAQARKYFEGLKEEPAPATCPMVSSRPEVNG